MYSNFNWTTKAADNVEDVDPDEEKKRRQKVLNKVEVLDPSTYDVTDLRKEMEGQNLQLGMNPIDVDQKRYSLDPNSMWDGKTFISPEAYTTKFKRNLSPSGFGLLRGTHAVQNIKNTAVDIRKNLGEVDLIPSELKPGIELIEDTITKPVKGLFNVIGTGYQLLPKDARKGINSTVSRSLQYLDDSSVGYAQKLNLDPLLSDLVITGLETALTWGAGSGGRRLLQETGEAFATATTPKLKPAFVGINDSSSIFSRAVNPTDDLRLPTYYEARTANILGESVPITKTGSATTEWFRVGGGLDQELEKILTFGRGKNKKIVSYEELVELAKKNPNAQSKLDKYRSLMATPPASSAGDVLVYGYESKLLARTAALQKHANYIPAYHKSLEFHHASMKALEFRIHRKARELLKAGIITEDDLVRLHNVGEAKNIQSGSRAAAGIDMHRQPHNLLHKEIMLPKGIQPSHQPVGIKPLSSKPKNISSDLWKQMKAINKDITKFDTEYITAWGDKGIEKWKAFRKTESYKLISKDARSELARLGDEIDSFNNIEDLINFRSDMINNIVTPMTDEALLLERALDKLSTPEVLKLDDDITPLWKARTMQLNQEKAKKTLQQETVIEDAMKQAYK